ncbi:hypothetical protein [Nodularia sphaerocarpa]|uniref:hypothetical protein n=1 Tax=Nodularia sphaerocarpa TaxID=137816 RepID=UPI001EFA7671|nr:hypothetical protein [Nodularia sphaerocarpa]MDB9375941.1 hypothetical protein [Nodularia sphaerocarpa CS-585]
MREAIAVPYSDRLIDLSLATGTNHQNCNSVMGINDCSGTPLISPKSSDLIQQNPWCE